MRNYIYKVIVLAVALIFVFEFTIGRKFNQINEKVDSFYTKEGRERMVTTLKKEIKKANEKENYLDEEERELLRNFIFKIRKELDLN
tara:strand:+ start:430 stop:690 length:261 start_codon:yes stop_codon:yes gene_type:complete